MRGFPQADGSLPDPASAQSSAATSILSVFADRAALASQARSVESSGAYSFELQAPAGWMAFGDVTGKSIVRGVMQKAPLNHQLNPTAWGRLKQTYPHYFDGDLHPSRRSDARERKKGAARDATPVSVLNLEALRLVAVATFTAKVRPSGSTDVGIQVTPKTPTGGASKPFSRPLNWLVTGV